MKIDQTATQPKQIRKRRREQTTNTTIQENNGL